MIVSKDERGFSLIELLIVVAIIGIIAAIAVPGLSASRSAAQRGAAVGALRTMVTMEHTYNVQNGRYARLIELNQATGNGLGQQAGPTLRKSGYIFQMVPTAPTDDQLVSSFTIAATGQGADGSTIIFMTDEAGTISQVSP